MFISLERKDDPCKTGGRKHVFDFTLVEKMSNTLPLLVFISLERKDDPCKTGGGSRSSIFRIFADFTSMIYADLCKLQEGTHWCPATYKLERDKYLAKVRIKITFLRIENF